MTSRRLAGTWSVVLAPSLLTILLASCADSDRAGPAPAAQMTSSFLATPGLPITARDNLAQRLVTQSAGVREGEVVLISGGVRDAELLEDIAVHVRKLGAFPLITLNSDRMTRRMYDDVDPRYDMQLPALDLKLFEMADVVLSVDAGESADLLAHVPPERIAARARASEPVMRLFEQRAIRGVNLGNALYPTQSLAEQFGVSQEQLARTFWNGVNVDYKALEERGRALEAVLASGRELHITGPGGTDLRVRIEGRPIFVSDGVISEEDRQRGSAGSQVWLPAGEVFLAPVPGSAEGTVVVDRHFFQGKEIRGLSLTFRDGRLTGMTAASGLEPLRAMYDAAGAGRDELGVIDFGFNPNVRLIPDSRMVSWVADGMVTIQVGGNTWAGGTNNVPFGLPLHLTNSTVTVDGRPLLEAGNLKL